MPFPYMATKDDGVVQTNTHTHVRIQVSAPLVEAMSLIGYNQSKFGANL